ncbi:MAG TPA: exosortase-associated EpsI family protein [Pirellulaceae bacterium]|nr:exosortase-associated EpsI family protein [Pirellulaceae bacterium]
MKNLTFVVCSCILLVSTVAAGWVQRSMSHAWGNPRDRDAAAARLSTSLPEQIGDWRFDHAVPFPEDVLDVLGKPTHISHVYENMRTGDFVTVAVIVGHPGPVAVHTPEICYSSRDYKFPSARTRQEIKAADGRAHALWTLGLDPKEAGDLPLKVMYAWSTGTTWEAAERPRYSYGGLSHLYKLQLAVGVTPQSSEAGFDPAGDFLTNFLAVLQGKLVESDHRQKAAK